MRSAQRRAGRRTSTNDGRSCLFFLQDEAKNRRNSKWLRHTVNDLKYAADYSLDFTKVID